MNKKLKLTIFQYLIIFQYSYDKYMSEFPRAPGSPSNSSQVELLSQFAESNSHQTLEELQLQSATGFGAGLVCLCAETLVGYPFIVLRRQCQVGVTVNDVTRCVQCNMVPL